MQVFIRNIPGDTSSKELIDFVSPALKGGLLKAKGKLTEIKILALRDRNTKLVEYHAVVKIEPDNVALRAIKQLNAKRFRNKVTGVRQYHMRTNRKAINLDRRRNIEVIEHYVPRYAGHDSFRRVYST